MPTSTFSVSFFFLFSSSRRERSYQVSWHSEALANEHGSNLISWFNFDFYFLGCSKSQKKSRRSWTRMEKKRKRGGREKVINSLVLFSGHVGLLLFSLSVMLAVICKGIFFTVLLSDQNLLLNSTLFTCFSQEKNRRDAASCTRRPSEE